MVSLLCNIWREDGVAVTVVGVKVEGRNLLEGGGVGGKYG